MRPAGRDPAAVIQAEQVRAGDREDGEDRQRDGGRRGLGAELKHAQQGALLVGVAFLDNLCASGEGAGVAARAGQAVM